MASTTAPSLPTAKSISHETTCPADIADVEILRGFLGELVEQVGRRLRRHGLRGHPVELKVRFAVFKTITRLLAAGVELLKKKLPAGHGVAAGGGRAGRNRVLSYLGRG